MVDAAVCTMFYVAIYKLKLKVDSGESSGVRLSVIIGKYGMKLVMLLLIAVTLSAIGAPFRGFSEIRT